MSESQAGPKKRGNAISALIISIQSKLRPLPKLIRTCNSNYYTHHQQQSTSIYIPSSFASVVTASLFSAAHLPPSRGREGPNHTSHLFPHPESPKTMSYYNQGYQPSGAPPPASSQNLQFFSSSYDAVSGHTTPSQASYGGYGGTGANAASAYPSYGGGASSPGGPAGFGGAGVSGRMGEQGGLRTGWLAAFGTEGYDGEPSLLEELGVNFGHIKTKVSQQPSDQPATPETTNT